MNIHSMTETPMTARVLDAALEVLTERTYGGAAVPRVAERAGIGVGTIYRSFPGKEALANAVFRRAKQDLLDHLRSALAALPDDAGTRARVQAMWTGLAAFAAADPAGFAYLEHQQHGSYLDAESEALAAQVESLAVEVVHAGQASGDLRDGDPAMLVSLVFGAFVGLTKHARALGAPIDDAVVVAAADAVWYLLRRPSTPS